jgi:hypothetical protein
MIYACADMTNTEVKRRMNNKINRLVIIPIIILLALSMALTPVSAATVERIVTRGASGLWEDATFPDEDADLVVEVLDESEIGEISLSIDILFDEDPRHWETDLVPSEFRWGLGVCTVSTEIYVDDEVEDFTISITVEWDTAPPTLKERSIETINGERVITTSVSREGVATITLIFTPIVSPVSTYMFADGVGEVWETTSLTITS